MGPKPAGLLALLLAGAEAGAWDNLSSSSFNAAEADPRHEWQPPKGEVSYPKLPEANISVIPHLQMEGKPYMPAGNEGDGIIKFNNAEYDSNFMPGGTPCQTAECYRELIRMVAERKRQKEEEARRLAEAERLRLEAEQLALARARAEAEARRLAELEAKRLAELAARQAKNNRPLLLKNVTAEEKNKTLCESAAKNISESEMIRCHQSDQGPDAAISRCPTAAERAKIVTPEKCKPNLDCPCKPGEGGNCNGGVEDGSSVKASTMNEPAIPEDVAATEEVTTEVDQGKALLFAQRR